jgi:hypothetical protein
MPFEDNTAFGCSLGTTESADTVVVVGIFGASSLSKNGQAYLQKI